MSQASELIASQVGSSINNQKTWGSIISNVKDPQYGAKGDGTTDDTIAIQKALNDANSALVVMPKGSTFLITSTIIIPDGKTLMWGKLKVANNANIIAVSLGNQSRLVDVEIDGNRLNQTANTQLVYLNGVSGAQVKDCILHGSTLAGVVVGGGQGTTIESNTIYDVYTAVAGAGFGYEPTGVITKDAPSGPHQRKVIRNTIYNIGQVGIDTRSNAENVLIEGNDISEIGIGSIEALGIQSWYLSHKTQVIGNKLSKIPGALGTAGWMISIDKSRNAIVADNQIEINSNQCPYGIEIVACSEAIVTGNNISRDALPASSVYPAGIIINRSSFCTVSGNTITDYQRNIMYGIWVKGFGTDGYNIADMPDGTKTNTLGCFQNVITGNTLRGVKSGVQNDAYTYKTIISNNNIDADTNAIQAYAGDGVIVSGNVLRCNNTAAGIGNAAIFMELASALFPIRDWLFINNQIYYSETAFALKSTIDNVRVSMNNFIKNTGATTTVVFANNNDSQTNVNVRENTFKAVDTLNGGTTATNWSFANNASIP